MSAQPLVDELLASTSALGVWLLGAPAGNEGRSAMIAAAVQSPDITAPQQLIVNGEVYLGFADRKIFAQNLGGVVIVVVFDDRSSLGLIRLRVRNSAHALARSA